MMSVCELIDSDFEKVFENATIIRGELPNFFEVKDTLLIEEINHPIFWTINIKETKTQISLNSGLEVQYLKRSLRRLLAFCGFDYKWHFEKGKLIFTTDFTNENYLNINLREIVNEFAKMVINIFILVNATDPKALEESLREMKNNRFKNVPLSQMSYELTSDKKEDEREKVLSQEDPQYASFIMENGIDQERAIRSLQYQFPKFEAQVGSYGFSIDLFCNSLDYRFPLGTLNDLHIDILNITDCFLLLFAKARGEESVKYAADIKEAIKLAVSGGYHDEFVDY